MKAPRPVRYEDGWELYRKMGSPKFVAAPMVNQSELPFRLLNRKYKTELCYTPMLHAGLFSRDLNYRHDNFETCKEDRPLVAQFCANDPDTLLSAARHLEGQVDAIDLNFGCPQGIAKRGNYGAFLLSKPQIMKALVTKLHQNLSTPVTCKVRQLNTIDEQETLDMVQMLQDAGCHILTIHGRTKEMLKDKVGPCNFDIIKKVKAHLKIPVFANGGIETLEDVWNTIKYTGVDGVMVSEALLSNPALFAGPGAGPQSFYTGALGPYVDPVVLIREYLAYCKQYPRTVDSSMIRGHIFKILFRSLSAYNGLREELGNMYDPSNIEPLLAKIKERDEALSKEELEAQYAVIPTWYRRHQTHKHSTPKEEKEEVLQEVCPDGFANLFGSFEDGVVLEDTCEPCEAVEEEPANQREFKLHKKEKKKQRAAMKKERARASQAEKQAASAMSESSGESSSP